MLPTTSAMWPLGCWLPHLRGDILQCKLLNVLTLGLEMSSRNSNNFVMSSSSEAQSLSL